MKGKQLTLEEVLELEDGTKVWVEDTIIKDEQIGIIEENEIIIDDGYGWFDLNDFCEEGYIIVYEWIEDNSNPMMIFEEDDESDIIYKLAQEICNLRGLDLTDDNIRLIIEEFMEEK